jgi:hypothetical protein
MKPLSTFLNAKDKAFIEMCQSSQEDSTTSLRSRAVYAPERRSCLELPLMVKS